MSPDPQTATTDASEPAAVLEWGATTDDDDEGTVPRRRWGSPGRLARGVLDDRRLVPTAASLGVLGVFASLMSEWQVTSVNASIFEEGAPGQRPIVSGLADLGSWGAGYLAGLFLLVSSTVLLLFGPASGRRYARLVALSTGGALLALLAAMVADLDDNSRDHLLTFQLEPAQFQVAYGRGVWCALFGVAATTVAVYLAGRHLAAEPGRPAATAATAEPAAHSPVVGAAEVPADGAPDDDRLWRWQPPARDNEAPAEPLGLTVSPATPFTTPVDDRDKLR